MDLPRNRVLAALDFRPPDRVPVEYHFSPGGFWDHGEKLRQLWLHNPDDFGPPDRFPMSRPPEAAIGEDGLYNEIRRDGWGVVWKHKVFGAAGFPIQQPLDDWSKLRDFRVPAVPVPYGPEFEAERERARAHQSKYFLKSGWISLFELLHALRRFEDVLTDIATGVQEIQELADRLTDYHAAWIRYLLARGVDAIQFGDDFGTQSGLVLSPRLWRSFFKPRYQHLIDIAKAGGARVFFHSCGAIRGLLDDVIGLGADAIWPQLNTFDLAELAARCRAARVAIALQPDRGDLMIRSSPQQVREYVLRLAEQFDVAHGGAWFYVEIDNGFPFENVVALTETIASLRGVVQAG